MEKEAKDDTVEVGEGVEEAGEETKDEVKEPEGRQDAEEEEEEEEEEEAEEIKPVKKRRCQRKKKIRGVCLDEEGEAEEEELPNVEEEEEEEDEEEEESDIFSYGSSILSGITFEWENEVYEFEELCDPGNIETIYQERYELGEIPDELGIARYQEICQALSILPMVRIIRGLGEEEIDLSHRNIDSKSIRAMCAALEFNNRVRRFILKFNKLVIDDCWYIGRMLKTNETISYLDFSGCSYQGIFSRTRGLQQLSNSSKFDLECTEWSRSWESNRRFFEEKLDHTVFGSVGQPVPVTLRLANLAVIEIRKGLAKSSSLEILKIGKNPMLNADTEALLAGAKKCSTLQLLDLEDLWVSKKFLKILAKILKTKELEVNYSGIYSNYVVQGPDYPKVILKRAQFEAMKPKSVKKRKDFGHLMWTLGEEPLSEEDFMLKVKKFKAKISKELFPELIKQFMNPRTQLIDVVAMKNKYLSLFPDSTPPPPPKPKKGAPVPAPEEPKKEEEGGKAGEAGDGKKEEKNLEGGEGEEEEEGELYIEGLEDEGGEMYIEGVEAGEGDVPTEEEKGAEEN